MSRSQYDYVDKPAPLGELLARLKRADEVPLDTEANSLYRYRERVCLIQLSLGSRDFIVDPLSRIDLSEFLRTLSRKPLVLHGADYDLRMMRASFGFRPRRAVFDTMIAAQLLGFQEIGLAALVDRYFDIKLSKGAQRSNWGRRPLPPRELRYAVDDTRFLHRLKEELSAALDRLGRTDWHREACERLVKATAEENHRAPETEWRIKGASALNRQQLAYLRQLWQWRDREAQRIDRPLFRVLHNEALIRVATWAAAHPEASIRRAPGLPRNFGGPRLQSLQEAVDRARLLSPEEYPPRRVRGPARDPQPDCRAEVERLRDECARLGRKLRLPPQLIAPKAAVTAIARSRPKSLEEMIEVADLMRWQGELLWPAAQEVCGKKTPRPTRRRSRRPRTAAARSGKL